MDASRSARVSSRLGSCSVPPPRSSGASHVDDDRRAKYAPPQVRQTRLLIDGEWRESVTGKSFGTFNPATEAKIADVAEGSAEDIDLAVKAARRALQSGPGRAWTPATAGGC